MIAIPAAVQVDLNQQSAPGRAAAEVPLPPSCVPKRSVAAARSWGDAIRSCRPAPDVTIMPMQRTLVTSVQSAVADVPSRRPRQRTGGSPTPSNSRPGTGATPRAQQRSSPRGRIDAQWKLDDNQDLSAFLTGARQASAAPRPKLDALQTVPGVSVIGQRNEGKSTTSSGEVDTNQATPVDTDNAMRQLVEHRNRQQQHGQRARRPATPKQSQISSRASISGRSTSHSVVGSPKAENFRGMVDLRGTQHRRSATAPGVTESRRSTICHIDDIIQHSSRTPRQPGTHGLITDERARAPSVSSTQHLPAARLRREGVYVTDLVQPVLPHSVFCCDQRQRKTIATTSARGLPAGKTETPVQRPSPRPASKRVTSKPVEDDLFAYARPWTPTTVDIAAPSQPKAIPSDIDVKQMIKGPSGWAPTRRPVSRGTSPGGARPYGYINSDLGGVGGPEQQSQRGVVPAPLPQPHLPP